MKPARRNAMDPAIALLEHWVDQYTQMAPIYHHLAQTGDGFGLHHNLCQANRDALVKAIKILKGEEVSFP
jgi:hypothetical protein